MDAENACNGGKANGSHLDNGRVNEFQSACSIRCVHDPIMRLIHNESAARIVHLRQPYPSTISILWQFCARKPGAFSLLDNPL